MTYVPAYLGSSIDHLYRHCPLMTRHLGKRIVTGPNGPPVGREALFPVDPLGTDLCGWCQWLWRKQHPEAAA